ncbi:MAG: hypothetical protein HRU11_00615 [Parvularculaceae bacterium]|nr:hypothetical protein [Parvularculaceae bacterium]
MKKVLLTTAASLMFFGIAQGKVLNFEEAGAADGEMIIEGDEFLDEYGVQFASSDQLKLVLVGPPAAGFWPNDLPDPADAFGDYFMGTSFDDGITDLIITYATPVSGLSFKMADIDGDEVFDVSVYDVMGELLAHKTIKAGDPGTGNRKVTHVGFSDLGADIAKVEMSGERSRGNLGIAFDEFSVDEDLSPVPVPAAAPLFGAAIAGGGLRRFFKKMAS